MAQIKMYAQEVQSLPGRHLLDKQDDIGIDEDILSSDLQKMQSVSGFLQVRRMMREVPRACPMQACQMLIWRVIGPTITLLIGFKVTVFLRIFGSP
jgi:hypothetical protein